MRTLQLLIALVTATPALADDDIAAPFDPTADEAVDAWRDLLRARRQLQVERLRAYATAGEFPRNDFQPGFASILIDAEGRPCAMAHLVIADGHRPLLEQLAAADNSLQFGAVTEGPLFDWILTSGLTQDEAAFVQAPDFFIGDALPPEPTELLVSAERERLRAHFLAAAAQIEAYTEDNLDVAAARAAGRPLPRS
jgi:hypothetical protein